MSKRPTDHLIPLAKKRSGDRQISREEPPSDSDEEVVAGEFRRADESTLKQRRIFKARRGAAAAVPASAAVPTEGMTATTAGGTAAPAAANPFASISLTAPAGGNPFSGVSLVPPADALKPAEAAKEAPSRLATGGASEKPEATGAAKAGEETAPESKDSASQPEAAAVAKEDEAATSDKRDGKEVETTSNKEDAAPVSSGGSAFATFASASGSGFGGLASGAAAAGNGFGGFSSTAGGFAALGNGSTFGALGSAAPAAPLFGSTAASAPASASFSFNTGGSSTSSSFTFPTAPAASTSFPTTNSIFGSTPLPATSVFGGAEEARPAALPVLPEQDSHRVTGEEEERCVFSGDGVLFEYAESQWRERGRGEMRVNVAVGAGAQARLVMRQRGNLRLLLNANLFPGMKLTPMDGGKGITFACVNAARSAEAEVDAKEEDGKSGEAAIGHLGTFAFRVKVPGKLEEFKSAAEAHIPAAEALGNENNV